MADANRGVMLESASRQPDQLVLQIGNLSDAGASEICVLDGIIGKLRLGSVNDDLAVLGLAVGNGNVPGLDSSSQVPQPLPGSFLSNILWLVTCPLSVIRELGTGPQWNRMTLFSSSP